jgi:hypothetical protein
MTTTEQRSYLTHMLGAESHINKKSWGYRNHYCASVGGKDERDLTELEGMGLVRRGFTINDGKSVYFFATEKGMDAAGLTAKQKKRAKSGPRAMSKSEIGHLIQGPR